jgi:hypothetical protein
MNLSRQLPTAAPFLQRQLDLCPKLTPLADGIRQHEEMHPRRIITTLEILQLGQDTLQPQRPPRSSYRSSIEVNMNDMNIEIVIRRLIMNIRFHYVPVDVRI